jgi:hypothetical protein
VKRQFISTISGYKVDEYVIDLNLMTITHEPSLSTWRIRIHRQGYVEFQDNLPPYEWKGPIAPEFQDNDRIISYLAEKELLGENK